MINMIATAIYSILILVVIAILIATRINYVRTKKNSMFLFLCVCILGWLVSDIAILFVMDIGLNAYVWNLGVLFAALAPLAFLLVLYQYSQKNRNIPKKTILLLLIIPALTSLVVFTSPLHSLMRNVESLTVWPRTIEYSLGAWFYVHTAYSFLLAITSAIVLVYKISKSSNSKERAAGTQFVVALTIMLSGSVVYMSGILPIYVNLTSMGAAIALIFMHMALTEDKYSFTFRMLNTLKSSITFPVLGAMFMMLLVFIFYIARTTRLNMEDIEENSMITTARAIQAYINSNELILYNEISSTGDNTELIRLGDIFSIDVTIYNRDGYSVASTIIHPELGGFISRTQAPRAIIQTVMGNGEHRMLRMDLLGIPYMAYYFPLTDENGNQNAMLFIGVSREYTLTMIATQLRRVCLIAVWGVSIVSTIMYFLIHKSLKPLGALTKNIKNVAMGNMNLDIDRSKITTDEIGMLTSDVCGLVDVIKSLMDDLADIRQNIYVLGDWNFKVDTDKYQNSFKDLIDSVFYIMDCEENNVKEIINVLKRLGDGDFNVEIRELVGDFNAQQEAIRAVIKNINSVTGEINGMIHAAAVLGDLHYRIDETKFKGGWREIMLGLDSIAEAVDKPVVEIMSVMNNLAHGDFSSKVSGDYKGDFLQIKNAVNNMMEILLGYITEITNSLLNISQGDLTHSINREYVGNFSVIKESLNNISATLNKTMVDISVAATQVLSGAKQISTSAADLANGAQEQASSIEELNATIDVINQQTQRNADSAFEANELSNKSTINAKEGNESMKQMLTAMEQIKESSGNISKIIKTIQDITFQTNLLSLNAAVEAARAGEQGKGFGVVAEEVRNLAGRSQTATTETTSLISDSISRVESGSSIAISTSEALETIVINAGEVSEIINKIAIASKEQAKAISQISEGLAQISKVVQNNSATSEETAAASQELNSQAEMLQQLVAYFKI